MGGGGEEPLPQTLGCSLKLDGKGGTKNVVKHKKSFVKYSPQRRTSIARGGIRGAKRRVSSDAYSAVSRISRSCRPSRWEEGGGMGGGGRTVAPDSRMLSNWREEGGQKTWSSTKRASWNVAHSRRGRRSVCDRRRWYRMINGHRAVPRIVRLPT